MAADVPAADSGGSAAATRPRIHVQGAVKSFSGRVVVDVDDLVLGDRPIEGLIGPNGAGKTTLMRMIMHSTRLDRGEISLLPREGPAVVLSRLPPYRVARHGVVKTNQVIMDFDNLTIWDSVLLAVCEGTYEQPHRIFSERAVFERHEAEVRHYLGLFGFHDPAAFAMSAGQKKLLDIVRCLLLRPKVLLLDEPTAGLPETLTEQLMTVIRELAAGGTSVVIVEHDLNVIWSLCDVVTFMAEGKVLLRGAPQTIRENRTVVEKYLGHGHV